MFGTVFISFIYFCGSSLVFSSATARSGAKRVRPARTPAGAAFRYKDAARSPGSVGAGFKPAPTKAAVAPLPVRHPDRALSLSVMPTDRPLTVIPTDHPLIVIPTDHPPIVIPTERSEWRDLGSIPTS